MEAIDDFSDALENSDISGIEEVKTELGTQDAKNDGLAEGLGFKSCGSD